MPPDVVADAGAVVEESADDVFMKAFEQLSAADNAANTPPEPKVDPAAPAVRTEADRALTEAQRDSAAVLAAGPTGPSGGGPTGTPGPSITGPTGITNTGDGGLPPDDKEKAAAAAAAATAAAEAAAAAAKAGPTGPDPIERLADLIQARQPVIKETPTPEQTGVDIKQIFTPEEIKFLGDYEKEYPDIAKAEFMRRRIEYMQLSQYMFKQFSDAVGPRLELLEGVLARIHAGDLQTQVPSYNNELRQKIVDWAATQPAYLRVAYDHVIKQGTVDEVADLISRFQAATGAAPAKPAATTQVEAAAATAAQAEAQRVAAAAAKLAPVSAKGAGRGVTAVAPNDFEGGFAWATKLLANI